MTEATAKKHLASMLRWFTGGTVLHLLADLFMQMAEKAHEGGDDVAVQQFREVAAALFVFGLGIDAACPREWRDS